MSTNAGDTARGSLPDATDIAALRAVLGGRVITPNDPDYDESRAVWNGAIDKYPAVIVRCAGVADVMAALDFARRRELPVAVRGGAHNVAGNASCDGGIVIDLGPMNSVRVDVEARRVRAGAGATIGDLDRETQAFGLAVPLGVVSGTGIAGLTLCGGHSWLTRKHGFACDNLVSADLVTADGRCLIASEEVNEDLFWALRGGGGRLGVVTSFEFRLHELGPEVAMAQVFYPSKDAAEVLRFYRDFMAEAPEEVGCSAMFLTVPPVDDFPEAHHGKTAVALIACHSGPVDKGLKQLEPLRSHGSPILEVVQPIAYTVLQQSFNEVTPDGARYYWKSQYLAGLSDSAIATLAGRIDPLPGEFTGIAIEGMGGAIGRIDPAATAFPHRNVSFNLGIWAGWSVPADDEKIIAWTRDLHETMAPYSTGGMYANYLDHDDQDKMKAVFGDNHERLQRIKAKYDPDGLFRVD